MMKPERKITIIASLFMLSIVGLVWVGVQLVSYWKGVEIYIDQNGFRPGKVEVVRGMKVKWVNRDSQEHWPASDFHPTHGKYPEFDAKVGIKPGEAWIFVANKPGEWKYHDHLYPHRKGTLVVEGVRISNNKKDEETRVGVEKIWQQVLEKYGKISEARGEAHDMAHLAGGMIWEKVGWEGLKWCGVELAFGCYHGFLDHAFAEGLGQMAKAEEACGRVGGKGTGPWASCLHGVGHGVASFFDTTDLDGALASCENLENGEEYCWDGVFMEWVGAWRPIIDCDLLGEKYEDSCGRNWPMARRARGEGWEAIRDGCSSTTVCIEAVGRGVAQEWSGNVESIRSICRGSLECLSAAAEEVVFQDMEGWRGLIEGICGGLVRCRDRAGQIAVEYNRGQ